MPSDAEIFEIEEVGTRNKRHRSNDASTKLQDACLGHICKS